jgi:hypothetical protein
MTDRRHQESRQTDRQTGRRTDKETDWGHYRSRLLFFIHHRHHQNRRRRRCRHRHICWQVRTVITTNLCYYYTKLSAEH